MKRNIDICVISDFHLGTYGCRAMELLEYLDGIEPARLVLNGDIFDAWQFKKKYFPASHWEVIGKILEMSNKGTIVYYLTGNHDGILKRLHTLDLGNIHIRHQLELKIHNKFIWFFHGDIFDASVLLSPRLAALGGRGYDWLIRLNTWVNRWRSYAGLSRISFAHKVKASVKHAVKFVQDFEKEAINLGIRKGMDAVVCGHIHQPLIKKVVKDGKEIIYLNSGDWVENMTALEYKDGDWRLHRHGVEDHHMLDQFLSHLEDDQFVFNDLKGQKSKRLRDESNDESPLLTK